MVQKEKCQLIAVLGAISNYAWICYLNKWDFYFSYYLHIFKKLDFPLAKHKLIGIVCRIGTNKT